MPVINRHVLLAALVPSLIVGPASLASAEPLRLTVADSYELASKHSYPQKQRRAEQGAAEARVDQARGLMFPRLDFTARYSRVQEVSPGAIELPAMLGGESVSFGEAISSFTLFRVSVTQPLFTGFAITRRREAAALGVDVARGQSRVTDADVRLQVERAYFGLHLALELEAVAEQSVSVIDAHLARIGRLHDAGRATELDVTHAEAQLAEAELSREEARGAVQTARAAFVTLLGLAADADIELVDSPEEPGATPADLTDQALAARPELGVARTAALVESKRIDIARAAWWPTVSFQAGYTVANPNERYFPPEQEFNGAWDASIVASWSLDWGITSSRVDEARYNAAAAAYRVAALEDQTRAEAAQTESELSTASRRVAAARKAVDATERAFAAAERLFELGRLDSTDLLDRELDLRRARARLVRALVDRRLAAAGARRLTDSTSDGDQ